MSTPTDRLDQIADDLSLFDDWDSRYAYIVELGERLPPMPAGLKVENHRVKACMSRVHVLPYWDPDAAGRIRFHGDCDTAVIKGVLAILIALVDGRTPAEVEALDLDQLFEKLNLADQLSPNRHVGIYAIVALMKEQVRALAADDGPADGDGGPVQRSAA